MRLHHFVLTGLAAALCVGCSSPPAPSQTAQKNTPSVGTPPRPAGGHGLSAVIAGYDANNDGVVTRAEYDAVRQVRFKAADKNGDGVLNEEEYVAEFELRLKRQYMDDGREPDERYAQAIKQAGVRFAVIDRNRDGKISAEENNAVADRTFVSSDTNGDGVLSKEDPPRERRTDADADAKKSERPNASTPQRQ